MATPSLQSVVYVVAKAPRAGQAKTRLSPPLTPEQAARLAAAFLQDTIALTLRAGVEVRLICRDEDERAALLPCAGVASVHVQRGTGLGAALETAFVQGMEGGYAAVAVLGADTPTLPAAVVARAFAALEGENDVVLGPSDDGGYYLLAARRLHPELFRDMTWSTSDVAAETLRRCAGRTLRTHLLPEWGDVDDAAALARLRASLAGARPDVAPHTRAALSALDTPIDAELYPDAPHPDGTVGRCRAAYASASLARAGKDRR